MKLTDISFGHTVLSLLRKEAKLSGFAMTGFWLGETYFDYANLARLRIKYKHPTDACFRGSVTNNVQEVV